MQLALRRAYQPAFRIGLGQSGETDTEGTGLPDGGVDTSSGEGIDPTLFQPPGFNIGTEPGVDLSPAELAAEQARASAWLASIPGALSVAGKVALSAAQIAQGVAAGNLKPSSTCPSGYLVSGSGQCVTAQGSPGLGLLAGIPNSTLAIAGVLFLALVMMSSGGGRRR